MKRTTLNSFGVAKLSGYKRMPPYTERIDTKPQPPAIFAPFLNTGEDTRLVTGPASPEHIIPITVEPRTAAMSVIRFQDRSSHRISSTQSRTSRVSGPTSSHASGKASDKASGIPSSTMSDSPAQSSASQSTKLSGTAQKSHSEPLWNRSKAAGFKGRSQLGGGTEPLLPFIGCILTLMVLLILLSFMLWANSRGPQRLYVEASRATQAGKGTTNPNRPPGPTRPVASNVGGSCSETAPCLGEARCVNGVCWCKGSGMRVVKGICVSVATPATKKPRSPKSTSSMRYSTTNTLPPVVRFTFGRTVRLGTATTNAVTETAPGTVTTGEDQAQNGTEVGGTAHNESDSRETAASNVTAQREENVEKRRAPPE